MQFHSRKRRKGKYSFDFPAAGQGWNPWQRFIELGGRRWSDPRWNERKKSKFMIGTRRVLAGETMAPAYVTDTLIVRFVTDVEVAFIQSWFNLRFLFDFRHGSSPIETIRISRIKPVSNSTFHFQTYYAVKIRIQFIREKRLEWRWEYYYRSTILRNIFIN